MTLMAPCQMLQFAFPCVPSSKHNTYYVMKHELLEYFSIIQTTPEDAVERLPFLNPSLSQAVPADFNHTVK
jgi:hypothetical protein